MNEFSKIATPEKQKALIQQTIISWGSWKKNQKHDSFYRWGIPTEDFWAFWKNNKTEITALGFKLIKPYGKWHIQQNVAHDEMHMFNSIKNIKLSDNKTNNISSKENNRKVCFSLPPIPYCVNFKEIISSQLIKTTYSDDLEKTKSITIISDESEIDKLHPLIQSWVHEKKWNLNKIQKLAIAPIISKKEDVIICAPTAGGKTEAVFFPVISNIIEKTDGIKVLCISPLKSLINDQFLRINKLCETLNINVFAYHGDIEISEKNKLENNPNGILFITPESLDIFLKSKSEWVKNAFSDLQYIIIDELHIFIGKERGAQILSLMQRIESLIQPPNLIPRIGLSATLGDVEDAAQYLRPVSNFPCSIINEMQNSLIKIMIHGYENSDTPKSNKTLTNIAQDIHDEFSGSSNLIFTNTRKQAESLGDILQQKCNESTMNIKFFVHHGSISQEARKEIETHLRQEEIPTNVICTTSLELGVDIGKIDSIAQIGSPPSIASLRQRLGRSGRRGEPAKVKIFIQERVNPDSINEHLRMNLVEAISAYYLIINEQWCEPPDMSNNNYSTLCQQIISIIAQHEIVKANELYKIIFLSGAFNNIPTDNFLLLLQHLESKEIIMLDKNKDIILAEKGKKISKSMGFSTTFNTLEEYDVCSGSTKLGRLQKNSFLLEGKNIILGGKRWQITNMNSKNKIIYVKSSTIGEPPKFENMDPYIIHHNIRAEMRNVYLGKRFNISETNISTLTFLNDIAKYQLNEAVCFFNQQKLDKKHFIIDKDFIYFITFAGSKIINTLNLLLISKFYKTDEMPNGIIKIYDTNLESIIDIFHQVLKDGIMPHVNLNRLKNYIKIEKYDNLLPEELLIKNYCDRMLDIHSTQEWLKTIVA